MAWRDYRDLLRLVDEMQRFTEETLMGYPDSSRFWQPAADVHETEAGILIKLELPGISVEDVHVSLSGDGRRLSVSGVRAEPADERAARTGCYQLEIYFGPFERSFALPAEIPVERDGITATLKDGFLTIFLPRRKPAPVETRTIPIEVVKE